MQPQTMAEVGKTAYERMVEFSVIGAILAIVLISSIALVFWVIRTYNKKDEARDAYLYEVNNRRAETAEKAVEAQTKTNERINRMIDILNILVERGRAHGEKEEDED